ncbi:MAG: aminopeptidase P family protein [Chloroflexi bacterium]|nr:aminopeptidase P family protein [Chloroflexota bacterium]
MSERLRRLRERLAEAGLDGFLVGAPVEDTFHAHAANRRYLSDFTGSMGWLLITADAAFIAVDFRYFEQAERESPGFTLFRTSGGMESWFGTLVGEAGLTGKRIGFEPAGTTVSAFQSMKKALEKIPSEERPKLLAAPPLVEELRTIKQPEEIAAIQRAVDLGDEAFQAVAQRIEPGWTEQQVAWEIEKYAREHGADGLSFETIVAAGPWGAMPHAQPRERPIEAGEPIVIDMGVKVDGYCSDLTRTITVDGEDGRFREIYDIVLTAQLTAEELVKSGMSGEEAHMLAHNVIAEAGYGENFGHGLGHGVGLLVHESPRLARMSKDELKDGMVATIEPGIYISGWGGVRIEDMVVMENGKARLMSHAPKLQA